MEQNRTLKKAAFAGGCFWCMVPPFEDLPGVVRVVAGYAGGHTANPTYQEVCSGKTGHYEAVEVTYDPDVITYADLLEHFWPAIDPTDDGGQFFDRGKPYQTVIFYQNEEERHQAEASKASLNESHRFNQPIATAILPADKFYPAEAYHQKYHKNYPDHYQAYKKGSGREAFIKEIWGPKEQK